MGKRAKTEGSIYYSEARGKWVAQLPSGPDGRRPLRTANTEGEALALLRTMHAERAQGRDLSRKAETIEQLLDDYLDAVRDTARPATVLNYETQIDHINKRIGQVRIDALALEGAQRLATTLAREHGPTVARLALQRLRAAYDRVVPERVSRNPVDMKRIKIARHQPAERRPLEDAEVRGTLVAGDNVELMGHYSRYGVGLWLMALLGLRRGETCGASWRDVDWKKAELHVRQQFAPDLEGGFSLGPIKTAAGVRVLPLGPRLLARLRQHWELQQEERRLRAATWKEHGLILADEDGSPVYPQNLNALLRRLRQLAGGPHIHPHLLRHTLATAIADEGFSEAVVAAVLGHGKGGSVTRRYTHATEKAKKNAVLAIEARFTSAPGEGAQVAE